MNLEQLIFRYASDQDLEQQVKQAENQDESGLHPFASPPIYEDPRPDLKEDTHLWAELLKIAYNFHPLLPEKNEEFCGVLNGMRCGGTRIRPGKNGWVLRPDIDPTGRVAWSSQAEYDEMKEKYLVRWMEWLKFALKKLNEKHPFNQPSSGT